MKNDESIQQKSSIKGLDSRLANVMEYILVKNPKKYKTQSQVAKVIEFDRSNLSSALNGTEKYLTEGLVKKFVNAFPELNAEWLLTGKGEMLKSEHENQSPNIVIHKGNQKTRDKIVDMQEIPLYDLEATAGLLEFFKEGKTAQVLETIKIPRLPKCDGAVSVTGDSMYPLLKSGDIVMYKEIPVSYENIFFGEMYLLGVRIDEYEEMVTIKYIQKSEKGEGYVKLVSLNQHHAPKDVRIEKISAMAIVKASVRFNTMA